MLTHSSERPATSLRARSFAPSDSSYTANPDDSGIYRLEDLTLPQLKGDRTRQVFLPPEHSNSLPAKAVTAKPQSTSLWSRLFGFSWRRCLVGTLAGMGLIPAYLGIHRATAQASLRAEAKERISRAQASDPWPTNVYVYASSLQGHDSYGGLSGGYTKHLLQRLRESGSLSAAHKALESGLKGIFRYEAQLPVSSAGSTSPGWEAAERKDRFIIAISGDRAEKPYGWLDPSGEDFWQEAKFFAHALKTLFAVPDEHVQLLKKPDLAVIEEALSRVGNQIKTNSQAAEVLIYIASHGSQLTFSSPPAGFTCVPQGFEEGSFSCSTKVEISESNIKLLIRKHLNHAASVSIVLDICQAGAWIE